MAAVEAEDESLGRTRLRQRHAGLPWKSQYVAQSSHTVSAELLHKQGTTPLSALIAAKRLSTAQTPGSLTWQQRLLGRQHTQHLALTNTRVVDPAAVIYQVYDAGSASVGCTKPGFKINEVRIVSLDPGAPQLWYFPADAQKQRDWIEVA